MNENFSVHSSVRHIFEADKNDLFAPCASWTENALLGIFLKIKASEEDMTALLTLMKDPELKRNDVPSLHRIKSLIEQFPKTKSTSVCVDKFVKSLDGSTKPGEDDYLDKTTINVDLILPSEHLKREMASPLVSEIVNLSSCDQPDLSSVRDF